jgi:hypothetical protein
MEIIKLIINIIKKFFKYLFILIVIGGIVYGAIHFWNENENKKEAELNLAFFTSENYNGGFTDGVNWSLAQSSYYDNAQARYQQGLNKDGKMFYREVLRDSKPPTVATYTLSEHLGKNSLFVDIYWVIDCTPGSSQKYQLSETLSKDLRCSDNGEYLYLAPLRWHNTEVSKYEVNVSGFNYTVSTKRFNMSQLLQNQILQKLKEQNS